MSTNEIVTTIVGRAATAPREIHGGRVPYTSFRLATSPRYYDRGKGVWTEGRTEWLTVKVFRDTALNVAASVVKGQPLVAHGRLRTEEWLGEHGPRTGLVLEATALGHDLTRGRATWVRTYHRAPEAGAEGGADGATPGAGDDAARPERDPWAVDAGDGPERPDGRGETGGGGPGDVPGDRDPADLDELGALARFGALDGPDGPDPDDAAARDGADSEELVPTP